MKVKLIIAMLFFLCVNSIHAQYINTDSLVFIPGYSLPINLKEANELALNSPVNLYLENLSGGGLLMQFFIPIEGKVISRFGPRSGRMHTGTDIKMQKGDTIYAAFNGNVKSAHYFYGYGNLVVLQHDKDFETYYGHLSKFLVNNGEWVCRGEPIGLAGSTGRATTSHLHFEIRENDIPYDPELVFDFENGSINNNIGNTETLASLRQGKKYNDYSGNKIVSQNYIVCSGDSLWKISKRAKISVGALCQLNALSERSVLQVGQVLKVY